VGPLTVILAGFGFGFWLLAEGALCAFAPDFMRELAARLAATSPQAIALAGLAAAALGALCVTIAVRTA
jgi:uncharacterized protein YjeT (DUF2065 family)